MSAPETTPATTEAAAASPDPERRGAPDRRRWERRLGPRRAREVRAIRSEKLTAAISRVCATIAVFAAFWALRHPPLTETPTPECGSSLGAQVLVHRSLSPWWIAAVLLAVTAVVLPTKRRRSPLAAGFVGLTIGLGVMALGNVSTWTDGMCLALG